MDPRRRVFLRAFVPGAVFAGMGFVNIGSTLAHASQVSNQLPRQNPTPPPPSHAIVAPPPLPPSSAQLRQNERDIRKDVDQLFSLAQELKSLAGKSDAAQELSVGLIQKTEEIEKLAKKIRDLARS